VKRFGLIRALDEQDRPEWQTLWAASHELYESTIAPQVTETTWRRLLDPSEDRFAFVAEGVDGRLIGLAHCLFHRSTWAVDPVCYLQDLYVEPGQRGGGIGASLIKAVYGAADEVGASQAYWLTQEFNHTARRLYDQVATVTPFVKYRR